MMKYSEADAILKKALRAVAGQCDGARAQDNVGFAGPDVDFGKKLAEYGREYSPKQMQWAAKLATKYRRQVQAAGITAPTEAEVNKIIEEGSKPENARPIGSVTTLGGSLRVQFQFSRELLALCHEVKQQFGGRFDGMTKAWVFPMEAASMVVEKFSMLDFSTINKAELGALVDQTALDMELRKAEAEAAAEAAKTRKADLIATAGDLAAPLPSGRVMYAHQQQAVEFIFETNGNALVGDDMGLGKTTAALVAAKAYAKVDNAVVIVLAPVSLRDNWLREAAVVGQPIEVFSATTQKIPAPLEYRKYVLIADEAHYYQEMKSQRTTKFMTLADHENCVARILLTGTPIKNGRPKNIFPLLKALKHPITKSKKAFDSRYCALTATRWSAYDNTGASNLAELHEKIKDVMIRRTKDECLDLPAKTRILRKAELSADAARIYDEAFRAARRRYAERIRKGEIMTGGEALVELTHLRAAGSTAKVESAIELALEVLEEGRSVIIFLDFAQSAKRVAEALKTEGHVVGLLTGETAQKDRQAMVDRFQNRDSRVFVSTIKAGGVGITLTAADTVIMVDRPWTPGDALQAEDRAYRIGQTRNVTSVWLQCNSTDEKIDQILIEKAKRIEMVLTGTASDMGGLDMSVEDMAAEVLSDLMS